MSVQNEKTPPLGGGPTPIVEAPGHLVRGAVLVASEVYQKDLLTIIKLRAETPEAQALLSDLGLCVDNPRALVQVIAQERRTDRDPVTGAYNTYGLTLLVRS